MARAHSYETWDEISSLKRRVQDHDHTVPQLQRELAEAQKRIAQLELAVEALLQLQARAGVSREDLALLIKRIDLADGIEDGQIGPDRSADAPSCPQCGRPLNLQRHACLYCAAPISQKAARQPAPARLVTCVQCQAQVPEGESYFSAYGLVCTPCFQQGS